MFELDSFFFMEIISHTHSVIYSRCDEYLNEWTETLKEFECFEWMSMKKIPNWKDLEASLSYLINKDVVLDESKLFDQFCNLKKFINDHLLDEEFKLKLLNEEWTYYFQNLSKIDQHSQLLIIATFVFSIPAHNANVERLFSLISSQWTDERNRFSVENVKGIMFAQFNFKDMDCRNFYNFLPDNTQCLRSISNNEKYKKKVT